MGFEPTCPFTDNRISSAARYDHFDTAPCINFVLVSRFLERHSGENRFSPLLRRTPEALILLHFLTVSFLLKRLISRILASVFGLPRLFPLASPYCKTFRPFFQINPFPTLNLVMPLNVIKPCSLLVAQVILYDSLNYLLLEFWCISFVWNSFWHNKAPHLFSSIPYCLTYGVQFTTGSFYVVLICAAGEIIQTHAVQLRELHRV